MLGEDHGMQAASAGLSPGQDFPFCPECGAFQPTLSAPPLGLPLSAVQFRNPMQFVSDLPAQGAAPTLAERLAVRQKFEAAVQGSAFAPAALQQFEKQLEPLLVQGRADGAFAEQVAQFWAGCTTLVNRMSQLLKDAAQAHKTYPHHAALFKALTEWAAPAAKTAMQAVVSGGSSGALHLRVLELEWALGECKQAAYRMWAYMRLQRAKQLDAAFAGLQERLSLRGEAWVKHVLRQASLRVENEYWLSGKDAGREVFKRYRILCEQMPGALLHTGESLTMANWRSWLCCKAPHLSEYAHLHNGLRMGELLERSVEDLEADIDKGYAALRAEVQEEVSNLEESRAREQARREAEAASAQRQAEQIATVTLLIQEQQVARQMAEGKFFSAYLTSNFGARAGAYFEGFVRK